MKITMLSSNFEVKRGTFHVLSVWTCNRMTQEPCGLETRLLSRKLEGPTNGQIQLNTFLCLWSLAHYQRQWRFLRAESPVCQKDRYSLWKHWLSDLVGRLCRGACAATTSSRKPLQRQQRYSWILIIVQPILYCLKCLSKVSSGKTMLICVLPGHLSFPWGPCWCNWVHWERHPSPNLRDLWEIVLWCARCLLTQSLDDKRSP